MPRRLDPAAMFALACVLAAMASPAVGQQKQESEPVFRAEAATIVVDAVVTDRQGRPVRGLSAEDFVLREDDLRQRLTGFAEFDSAAARTSGAGDSRNSAGAERHSIDRASVAVLMIVDDLRSSPGERVRARQGLEGALSAMADLEIDLTVLAPGSGLAIRERLPAGVARLREGIAGLAASGGQASVAAESRMHERILIDTITEALGQMDRPSARNLAIVMSAGLPYDADGRGRFAYEALLKASLRANAPVYFVDLRGLRASDGGLGSEGVTRGQDWTGGAAVLEAVARETGGVTTRHANDLAPVISTILGEAAGFYRLVYEPTREPRKAAFRKISVETTRPGLRVRARKGYFAPARP